MSSLEPISVILVTAGSRGEKLLFRYPFREDKYVDVTGKSFHNSFTLSNWYVHG